MNGHAGQPESICSECGASALEVGAYCGHCGAAIPDPRPEQSWVISVPMLNNRFLLYDLGKVLVWTGVIVALLMLVMMGAVGRSRDFWEDYFNILRVFGYVLAGFGVMFLAIMLVFFGNRFRMGFTLDRRGVGWSSLMSRAKWANRTAVVAGLLAGKPGLAGAGLLAQTQESGGIEWGEIRKLKLYPALCTISVMNGWRVVVRLNCTPENYAPIAETIRRRATQATIQVLTLIVALLIGCPVAQASGPARVGGGLNFFTEQQEKEMGRRYARELNAKLAFVRDQVVVSYVRGVAERLVGVSPRPEAGYEFRVVNTREVNAFAVPGGFIYINRGLIELAEGEDEIAAVLAHEIAHAAARHGTRQLSKQILLQGILAGTVAVTSAKSKKWGDFAAVAGVIGTFLVTTKYSRNDEYQADALALELLSGAGYNPRGLVRFFERMDDTARRSNRARNFLAIVNTHPPASERVKRAELAAGSGGEERAVAVGREFVEAKAQLAAMPMPPADREITLSAGLRAIGLAETRRSAEAAIAGCAEPGGVVARREIAVAGKTVWLKTGLAIEAGQTVEIEAGGEILPIKNSDLAVSADGIPGTGKGIWKPLSWADTGALLARLEQGDTKRVLLIGREASFCAPFGGELQFGINDDNNFDNRGEFQVRVTVRQRGAR